MVHYRRAQGRFFPGPPLLRLLPLAPLNLALAHSPPPPPPTHSNFLTRTSSPTLRKNKDIFLSSSRPRLYKASGLPPFHFPNAHTRHPLLKNGGHAGVLLSIPISLGISHLKKEPPLLYGPEKLLGRIGVGFLATHALLGGLRAATRKQEGGEVYSRMNTQDTTEGQVRPLIYKQPAYAALVLVVSILVAC